MGNSESSGRHVLHIMDSFSKPSQTFIYDLIVDLEGDAEFPGTVLFYKRRMLQKDRDFPKVVCFTDIVKSYVGLSERFLGVFSKSRVSKLAFSRFLREQNITHIHCHFLWVLWGVLDELLDVIPAHVPIIVSAHGSDVSRCLTNDVKRRKVNRLFAKRESVVVTAPTEYLAKKLTSVGIPLEQIELLPNAVHQRFLDARKQGYRVPGSIIKVITCGRLVEWKGHDYLIEAIAEFKSNVSASVTLTIVGQGERLEHLQQLVVDRGLSENISFLGSIAHCDVPKLLAEHDIYVQPSIDNLETMQTETFGVAVLEAIAVGLPVIVSNVGGLPEVVGLEGSFSGIVEAGNSHAIYKALEKMYHDPKSSSSNIEYALLRLKQYSSARRLNSCKNIYKKWDQNLLPGRF